MSQQPHYADAWMQRVALLCAFLVWSLVPALAQSGTTGISGTVRDEQGRVIAGATVTLTDADRGTSRTQSTDNNGSYSFSNLVTGRYNLTIEASGFKKKIVENIQGLVDKTTDVSVALEVGGADEVVTVSASSLDAVINSQNASLGNNFVEQQIKQLPLEGRNVAALLSLQPGVTADGYVAGGRSDQANITLDGVDVNDQVNGFAFTPVLRATPDSVSEFRVTTVNADANQGRSSGAQISLVTKSGTNEFHGTLFHFHRNTVTTANDFFNNLAGTPRPQLIRNQFGGAIGGPVVKDRFFFFFTYEGLREAKGTPVTRLVPRPTMGQGILRFINPSGGITTLTRPQLEAIFPAVGLNPITLQLMAQAAQRYPVNNDQVGDGLNTGGFTFNAPQPVRQNTSIARLDWNVDRQNKHVVSVRLNYQYDNSARATQQFPDTPTPTAWQHPTGLAASHTWTISGNKINVFRFGITRNSFTLGGDSNQNLLNLRDVFQPFAFLRSLSRVSPVYNLVNDFTLIKGSHSFQFGGNVRIIRNKVNNATRSFDSIIANFSFYQQSGAVLSNPIIAAGFPISTGFRSPVQVAMSALIGRASQYSANFNFTRDGSLLNSGVPVRRDIATEEYEGYLQDTWRVRPNLTFTYGIRYSVSRPVYEQNGLQARTTVPLGDYFRGRLQGMQTGVPFNERIVVDLAGPANGKPGNYDTDWNNWQPRFAVAWSPRAEGGFWKRLLGNEGDTILRGGYGLVNDYYGTQIAFQFDSNNTLGFASQSLTPANSFNVTTRPGPLITGIGQQVRGLPLITIPGQLTFPRQQPSTFGRLQAIEQSLDATVRAPYNHVFNATIGRKLPAGLYVEASYIGRIGRNLLATRDIAALNNLRDPQSGQDWYTVAGILADLRDRNAPLSAVPNLPYFTNLFRGVDLIGALGDFFVGDEDAFRGLTPTQAVYASIARIPIPGIGVIDGIAGSDWTTLQLAFDYANFFFRTDGRPASPIFFQPQYGTLSAWSSVATSDYHGFTVSVRQRYKDQLTWDFNYTLSKSLDTASGLQRFGQFGSAFILNPIRPRDNRSFSDFDTRHIINFNSIWDIPVGRGRAFASDIPRWADAFIGGWQLTTIFRWNSGLPVDAPFDGRRWATNWTVQSNGVPIRPISSSPTRNGVGGRPNLFRDPVAASQSFRNPRAGETGGRNILRDPGFVSLDFGLGKYFRMPWSEKQTLLFRWEVFNATNTACLTGAQTVNYQIPQDSTTSAPGPNFGRFTATQGPPRIMQFALRYTF